MNKVLSSCLVILFLAGCATFPQSQSTGDAEKNKVVLSVAPILKFEDIPIPAGFKLLDKESFAFQNDKSRVALLKYYGGQNADQVLVFYKEQMASFNWSLVNVIEYERKVMNYEIVLKGESGREIIKVMPAIEKIPAGKTAAVKPVKTGMKQ